MDEPLCAHTLGEARYYLMVTPCEACGKGPWEVAGADPPQPGRQVTVSARCHNCGGQRTFVFRFDHPLPSAGSEAERINPTDSPSRIIDLGQWLSLFYMLVESAASASSPTGSRRDSYRAALCLAEALKFYGDEGEELPPAEAIVAPASLEAFHEHPEKFARQKLRDMQARLPALPAMAERIDRDEDAEDRPWWRFWGD